MPYQVSQLLKGLGMPVSASADEPVRDALDRMLHHGFSQLPVVKGAGQQRQFYLITNESILGALHNFGCRIEDPGLRVDDALVRVLNVYRATDDLFELLVGMREMNAALIVDDNRDLTNVVTTYDTSQYFRQWAEDTMQVRDIEHSLKRIINAAFKRPDGAIDEEGRQSAVEELTSAKRALRKKFGAAVKQYVVSQSTKLVQLRSDFVDLAFVEMLKGSNTPAITQAAFSGTDATEEVAAVRVNQEGSELSQLLAATERLRERFETGLKAYLDKQIGGVSTDDASVDDAFRCIYDRAEQVKEFGELTLRDYIQLFFKETCWGRCKDAIHLNEDGLKHMLEGVRDTRNTLAHFRDEEVTAQKRQQLKYCADWLSDRERLILDAFEKTIPI